MSSRTFNILKALFFIILAVFLLAYQFGGSGKSGNKWVWVGILISVVAAIGYLKQAFSK